MLQDPNTYFAYQQLNCIAREAIIPLESAKRFFKAKKG
jgi:hypothetical protein